MQHAVLSRNFQTLLLAAMLTDKRVLLESRNLLSEASFDDDLERRLCSSILSHFDKYGTVFSLPVAREYLRDSGIEVEDVDELLERLTSSKPDTVWVKDKVVEHFHAIRLQESVETAVTDLGSGEPVSKVRSDLLNSLTQGVREEQPGLFWEDNLVERLKRYKEQDANPTSVGKVPTGLAFLDEYLNGGLGAGEEGVVLARPNGGKSTVLINFGRHAVQRGMRVAHYTFEMSASSILRRYDQSFSELTRKSLAQLSKTAFDRLTNEVKKSQRKRLMVKEFATGTASPTLVDAHLNTVAARDGFVPDLLILDYAQLMNSPSKYDQMRHELAATHRAIVALAKDRQIPVWTAHQTNRTGLEHELLSMQDLAECFEVNAIADVIVGHNQKPEEKLVNQSRLNLIKNRDGVAGVWNTVVCDYSLCLVRDV